MRMYVFMCTHTHIFTSHWVIDYVISSNRHFPMQCNRNRLHFKCNRNQRLLSRLTKMFDCLPFYIMPDGFVCKEKDNDRTDLPINGLLSYLYT